MEEDWVTTKIEAARSARLTGVVEHRILVETGELWEHDACEGVAFVAPETLHTVPRRAISAVTARERAARPEAEQLSEESASGASRTMAWT